jgi:4-azaleucine resistance transporter AzlC
LNQPLQKPAALQHQLTFGMGVKDCIPTLLGYLSIGFAAGVIGTTSGLSLTEVVLMSIFLYAGSAQFIVASMFAASSSIVSIIITIFFVNLRHLLLSAAISPFFRHYSPLKNMFVGSQLTDETFGVAIHRLSAHTQNNASWMFGLNITAHVNWIIANLAGALFGAWIPEPENFGLNYALPAMFIGLVVMQIAYRKKYKTDALVVIAAVVSFTAAFFILPSHIALIAATIAAAAVGMVIDQWK